MTSKPKLQTRIGQSLAPSAILLLLSAVPAVAWESPPPDLATLVGERLEFRLKWQGIPAADAVLEVADGGDGKILFTASAHHAQSCAIDNSARWCQCSMKPMISSRTSGLAHLFFNDPH